MTNSEILSALAALYPATPLPAAAFVSAWLPFGVIETCLLFLIALPWIRAGRNLRTTAGAALLFLALLSTGVVFSVWGVHVRWSAQHLAAARAGERMASIESAYSIVTDPQCRTSAFVANGEAMVLYSVQPGVGGERHEIAVPAQVSSVIQKALSRESSMRAPQT